jgi:hypothetical protein
MLFMRIGVDQEIIDVDNDIGNVSEHPFHELLKSCGAPKKPHWKSDLVKLALAKYGKSCKVL